MEQVPLIPKTASLVVPKSQPKFQTLYEDSSEFEVAVFDLNVPWAQQAEKKSLNVSYKNQTIISKIYSHFDQISYVTEFWQLIYLASLVLFCFASIVTSYDNFKNSEMFLKLAKMSFCDSKYSFW